MADKIVLITGSTDGIGKQTARELAGMGYHINVHGRNKQSVDLAINEMNASVDNAKISGIEADLSSLSQVHKLADEIKNKYERLDVLINNAGVYMNKYVLTEDGYEMTFAVNHLSHFLLTNLLLDIIKKSDDGRIINVSSMAHQSGKIDWNNLNSERSFNPYGAYATSKIANILFTKELAEKLNGTTVTTNALHPGVITTKLLKAGFSITGSSVKKGAETSVFLATSSEVRNVNGEYFVDKKISRSHPLTYDKSSSKKFWDVSAEMVGLK